MKLGAVYILHYGAEWLRWSIKSVYSAVEQVHIFYTSTPSHGHSTDLVCPESREKLRDEAYWFNNVFWHDCGPFAWEGQHRDYAENWMFDHGFTSILIVDADELWEPHLLDKFISLGTGSNAKIVRVGMRHFWRSMFWVCDDQSAPHRMTNKVGEGELYYPADAGKVFHMGYAQSSKIIKYKMQIHGHKNEIRPGWYENIFLPWQPGDLDVHPTNGNNFWDPVEYVGDEGLFNLAFTNPYFMEDIIK